MLVMSLKNTSYRFFSAVLLSASEKKQQCEPQSSAKPTVSVGRELAV